ncbi:uncharacterized protein TRAVEDRAFT_79429, partial [Trametes versicolor FP-101664 SS1]|uniref:uncharacterized protein n=1 Tax=Trametes versicolor (strain FP-101664) TaxID=717944 RepID=UPI000462343F
MIQAAKKYGVRCETNNPSRALRRQMPAWYHLGRDPGRCNENTVASRCLRNAHRVRTVEQCERAADRVAAHDGSHVSRADCQCQDCAYDRAQYGCDNPHRCATAAAKLLGKLSEKWSLSRDENEDGLTLTPTRAGENRTARLAHERVLFNPSVSTDGPLAMALRVFVR